MEQIITKEVVTFDIESLNLFSKGKAEQFPYLASICSSTGPVLYLREFEPLCLHFGFVHAMKKKA